MTRMLQSFLDRRPELKEKIARAMFRTRLMLEPRPTSKARFVAYDHDMFRAALRDNSNKNGRELHSLMQLQHVMRALRILGRTPGGEVLEVGAGRAGLPVLLLLCGFDRVHINEITNAVNRFDRACIENLLVFAQLMGVCRRSLDDVVERLDDGHYAIRQDLLRTYAYTDAAELDIASGTLNAVVSFTVLEHLEDPRAVFTRLRRCLAPDGWMCHVVDMRDHADFTDPLHFLTIGATQYSGRNGEWCNRLRHSDFITLFQETGFDVRASRVTSFNELDDRKSTDFWKMLEDGLESIYCDELRPEQVWVTDEFLARIHPDYRRYDRNELSILQAEYVLLARPGAQ